MNLYRVTLKHDAGEKKLKVVARNKEVVKQMVCNAEYCPEKLSIYLQYKGKRKCL